MNLQNLYFDCAEAINIAISALIGIFLSYFTAVTYEKFKNKRKLEQLRNTYSHLASKNNSFDWQHWDLHNGKIVDNPIDSFMRLNYLNSTEFEFEWIESADGRIEGKGRLGLGCEY